MQKRRLRQLLRSKISLVRFLLTCAICAIALGALLSAHVFPFSKQREMGYQRWSSELSWTQEFSPPQLSKVSSQLSEVPPPSREKLEDANGVLGYKKLWRSPPTRGFVPCVKPSETYTTPSESQGYLLVHTNGGLNQMRAGISDMVAVARIINATLVIPELDKRSFWQDSSNFSDVFDEEHFISTLANDVKVVKKLPKELATSTKAIKHFTSWSGVEYYQDEISHLWNDFQVIRAAKSDSRLANNNLPPDIQRLRCRAFFQALRFAPRIEALGKLLVERMRSYGPYIALHLRYEKDMLAFSGCTFGLSQDEGDELTTIRENTAYWKVKDIDSVEQRSKGYCPLTPKEVGMFISSLGYPSSTPIYIAAGEIYGGDSRIAELETRFPLLMSKEKLASAEELEPFTSHASQMAALDYIVSVESDVFIPSYNGNMARAVEGHRRFLGHRKTITPDRKALVRLFDKVERGSLKEGKKLSDIVREIHSRRLGYSKGLPGREKAPYLARRVRRGFDRKKHFMRTPYQIAYAGERFQTEILQHEKEKNNHSSTRSKFQFVCYLLLY
ncbi:O-fucosyltransferase 7 isoform X2 [Aristolochia californica]|uniref:O-fucosyltransferase 7 isoform X2 n=1 Tax=Aristolochia californica TaxID=171875 RepID=UPI0035D6220F